ncbi:MAG: cobalamin-binding protein [Chloroflexi bacterium]|nr:cobalamin-binding protein [Chloroflexota bacterium]
MPVRIITALALVLSTMFSAASARAQQQWPLSVTDDSGVQTTFSGPPQRIVSLNPGHTETVFALGAGGRVVAVDSYSNYPAEAQQVGTRLTTYPTVSVETVVSLKPDLVLSLVDSDDVLNQLRQQGIPVLKLFPKDFDATAGDIEMLGRVLGAPDAGQRIAGDMRARRDAVVQSLAGAERPRVYLEIDGTDPTRPYVAGPNGYYGQLVDLAGGSNVFGDLPGDFGQVGSESVVARDPELIVLADSYSPFDPQTPAMVAARPGWDQTTAVQNGEIYAVQEQLLSSPGPRLVDGLEGLAYLIHPDRFTASGGPRLAPINGQLPYCAPGQAPAFSFGFQVLADSLGTEMGEPTECAHAEVGSGDTYQQTTKGLAIYRHSDNTPSFVSAAGRWTLTQDGVVQEQ